MSDVQATPAAVAVPVVEPAVPTPAAETAPVVAKTEDAPAVATESKATETPAVAAATAAPAVAADETKPVEAVNEGLLGYKAPGLLKQFTFAKKDFWFSDEPVTTEHLHLYLRGEKSEISHPVAAWASQTGKGLLFFVKKGETNKVSPAGVLPLYDATDLKKSSPHEFTFRLHNQQHSFKASSDAERDGWYQSIEKSMELGKASKESIHESEGYKAELAKLGTTVPAPSNSSAAIGALAGGPAAAATAASSTGVKSEAEPVDAKRANSEVEGEKKQKSRSTSRGVLNRFRAKKDEVEQKVEEKKEEKKAEKEEKKIEKEEKKAEKEEEKAEKKAEDKHETEEAVAVGAGTGAAVAAEENQKPKNQKRGSIFGSLKAGFKSPVKEKEQKDAELKTDAVAKDTTVSDVPPVLPETATAATTEPTASGAAHTETTPAITEPAATDDATKETSEVISTPNREKKTFLGGLGFGNKRDRSVSPSAQKETKPEGQEIVDATKAAETTEVPAAAAVETKTDAEETSPSTNKRQSVFGGLGRRASKMIQRVQQPSKKENASPVAATEKTAEEPAVETAPVVPAKNDIANAAAVSDGAAEAEPVVENKPEHVTASSSAPVAASA